MLFIFQPNMFMGVKCAGLTRKNIFSIIYVIGLSIIHAGGPPKHKCRYLLHINASRITKKIQIKKLKSY